jgi:hypothetical protein
MGEAARNEQQTAAEKLSLEEIWRRHPNEWVVLVDTDWDGMRTTQGVVYGHSPSRKGASAISRGLKSCAIFWTGKIQSAIWL